MQVTRAKKEQSIDRCQTKARPALPQTGINATGVAKPAPERTYPPASANHEYVIIGTFAMNRLQNNIKHMKTALASLVMALACTACNLTEEAAPPNIVVIMADDMGYGDVGAYNPDSKVPTPNMNRLAAEGIRFTDAHSPSAVCTPTRYALLTGRYAWRLPALKRGVTNGYSPLTIDTTRATVASVLQEHGYTTGAIGKWHLGLGPTKPTDYELPLSPGPRAIGFDYFYGIPASLDMPPYVWVQNESLEEAPTNHSDSPDGCCRGANWRSGAIAPSFKHTQVLPIITEKAAEYIRDRGQDRNTFFLYVPLSAPHTPWLPIEEFIGTSGAGMYGDFAAQVDATVGVVMTALEESGLADNTILVVTSDNGAHWRPQEIADFGHRANHDWRGMKADIHEGGHRVPFIVRWPGRIAAGTTTDQLAVHTDLFATLVDAAAAPLPQNAAEDSFSHLQVLLGSAAESQRTNAVHQSLRGMLAFRQGSWKYIEGKGSGGFTRVDTSASDPPAQLYDLSSDPAETINLFATHPETAATMQAALDALREAGRSRHLDRNNWP